MNQFRHLVIFFRNFFRITGELFNQFQIATADLQPPEADRSRKIVQPKTRQCRGVFGFYFHGGQSLALIRKQSRLRRGLIEIDGQPQLLVQLVDGTDYSNVGSVVALPNGDNLLIPNFDPQRRRCGLRIAGIDTEDGEEVRLALPADFDLDSRFARDRNVMQQRRIGLFGLQVAAKLGPSTRGWPHVPIAKTATIDRRDACAIIPSIDSLHSVSGDAQIAILIILESDRLVIRSGYLAKQDVAIMKLNSRFARRQRCILWVWEVGSLNVRNLID